MHQVHLTTQVERKDFEVNRRPLYKYAGVMCVVHHPPDGTDPDIDSYRTGVHTFERFWLPLVNYAGRQIERWNRPYR